MSQMVGEIEKRLVLAESSPVSLLKTPVAGLLSTIKRCIGTTSFSKEFDRAADWKALFGRIFDSVLAVSQIVSIVICDGSPEGFLPKEFQEASKEQVEVAIDAANDDEDDFFSAGKGNFQVKLVQAG